MKRFGFVRYQNPKGIELWAPGFYFAQGRRRFYGGKYRVWSVFGRTSR